jgi:hypothetical protein
VSGNASLIIPPELLAPIIDQAITAALARFQADHAHIGDKLAYSEAEAARLLSLASHQLRDERLRGRIQASVGPGRKILYSRQDLLDYLATRRWEGGAR